MIDRILMWGNGISAVISGVLLIKEPSWTAGAMLLLTIGCIAGLRRFASGNKAARDRAITEVFE